MKTTMILKSTGRVELLIHEGCKYTSNSGYKIARYTDVEGFDVIEGDAAKQIEEGLNENDVDEFHEYLVLYFKNGETSTFRNSHVDMFVI